MKRIRFGNEHMELSFDSLTGELLEFINIENGDNLLKNWTSLRTMPFNIIVDKTESITCHPIKYKLIKNNTDLSAAFENFAEKDGKVLKITYPGIASESEIFNIKVIVTIKLMNESGKNNQKRSFWNISVENNQEYPITKVLFPFICGVYIGSKYENDTLIFPLISGIKQQNPIKEMSQPAKILGWKWQEYKYSYPLDCFPSGRGNDGSYMHSALYGGNASMMWLDYYDESLGFYMASYDENFGLTYINAETFGETRPGMNFFFTMQTPLNKGEQSISHIFEIALHSGDWHGGADLYRDWRQSITKKEDMISPPSWFSKNSGMVAHYDFKYQSGEVVHKYKDIPTLTAQAKEMGLEHIMLSGWHKNGFDNGFPLYYCDEDLGDEAEFQKNVSEGVENGVHISFYVNSQLFNTKYKDIYPDLFNSSTVKKQNEEPVLSRFGDEDIFFAIMCPSSEEWQSHLKNTTDFLMEKIGGDGIYYDMLSMANGYPCYDKSHNHDVFEWNKGFEKYLNLINKKYSNDENELKIATLYEGVTDIHGHQACAQLITTMLNVFRYFPEIYRYTFPEQILTDMVYPLKRQVMRPVHVSQNGKFLIDRGFVLALYYWIYDLEEDSSFRNDPEMYNYIKAVIRLRDIWFKTYERGRFIDDININFVENAVVKEFILNDKRRLFAFMTNTPLSKTEKSKISFSFYSKNKTPQKAVFYDLYSENKQDFEMKNQDNLTSISCESSGLGFFVID